MRGKWVSFALICGLAAGTAGAQAQKRTTVDESAVNCSGIVTTAPVSQDSYIISGEKSLTKVVFGGSDLVYINRGSSQGVKVGDEFRVMRAVKEELKEPWFRAQPVLLKAMGQTWADLGKLRVVHVGPKVSTALVVSACDYMQRGDIIRPYDDRPLPALKLDSALVDPYASEHGKMGSIVTTKDFGETAGQNTIVYVNLGSAQGAKIGSYMRVFRYQGRGDDTIFQTAGTEYKMYGFGSTPVAYTWSGLPREILGEGIILRVSQNTATVMITAIRREIYVGDYVEIE